MTQDEDSIERDFKRSMLGCLGSLRAFGVSLTVAMIAQTTWSKTRS